MIAGCTLSVSLSGWARWLNDGQSIFWSNHNNIEIWALFDPEKPGTPGHFNQKLLTETKKNIPYSCTLSVSLSGWARWLNDGQSIFWSNHNLLQRGNL